MPSFKVSPLADLTPPAPSRSAPKWRAGRHDADGDIITGDRKPSWDRPIGDGVGRRGDQQTNQQPEQGRNHRAEPDTHHRHRPPRVEDRTRCGAAADEPPRPPPASVQPSPYARMMVSVTDVPRSSAAVAGSDTLLRVRRRIGCPGVGGHWAESPGARNADSGRVRTGPNTRDGHRYVDISRGELNLTAGAGRGNLWPPYLDPMESCDASPRICDTFGSGAHRRRSRIP